MEENKKFKEIEKLLGRGALKEARHLLMEMQARHMRLSEENQVLRRQLEEKDESLYLTRNLFYDGSCYWLISSNTRRGPFCQNCYHRDGVLIRLEAEHGRFKCLACGYVMEPAQTSLKSYATGRVLPFTG